MKLTIDPTIYIVDDDEGIRSSLTRSLTKRGFHVVSFDCATAFLDGYIGDGPDCLILDYGMPGMNGLELQQQLNDQGIAIPIIFVTGHGGVPESVQAVKAGAIDFLEKPFRSETLLARIGEALAQSAANNEAEEKANQAKSRLDLLTQREREIVDYIMENASSTTSKDIGRALNISPRTVDHHRARILEKMSARSVVELVDMVGAVRRTDGERA